MEQNEIEELWEKYKGIIHYQANKYYKKYPSVSLKEYESLGMLAFTKCVNRYDSVDDKLIRTCVINEIKYFFQGLASQNKKDDATVSFTVAREKEIELPASDCLKSDLMKVVYLTKNLTAKEVATIHHLYFKDRSTKETSLKLGVSGERVGQLKKAALAKIKNKYEEIY